MLTWVSDQIKNAVKGTIRVAFNTFVYLTQQIGVAPKVLESTVMHAPSRKAYKDMFRIAVQDVLPMVIVGYLKDSLDELIESNAEDYRKENDGWLSIYTTLLLCQVLLNNAYRVYQFRQWSNATKDILVQSFIAPRALNSIDSRTRMLLPKKEEGFLEGFFRDIVSYELTNESIKLLKYVPLGGNNLARGMKIYHTGRFALMSVLPELGSKQKLEYLKEYPELALSLGLMHEGTVLLLTSAIEYSSGVSREYYEEWLGRLLLTATIAIAAHQALPRPVEKSTRKVFDPLTLYQDSLVFMLNTIAIGLEKQLPKILNNSDASLPWQDIAQMGYAFWQHEYTQWLKVIFLPKMLRSGMDFLKDPIISPHWEDLRAVLGDTIEGIENFKSSKKWGLLIKAASISPETFAIAVKKYLDIPIPLAAFLIRLINDKDFMRQLNAFKRNQLPQMTTLPPMLPIPTPGPALVEAPSLENVSSKPSPEVSSDINSSNSQDISPRRGREILKGKPQKAPRNPRDLLKGACGGNITLFKNNFANPKTPNLSERHRKNDEAMPKVGSL